MPIEDKVAFLLKLNEAAMKTKGVSFVNSSLSFVNEQKFLATSDGSRIEQYLIRSFPEFTVTAVNRDKGDFQTRRSLGGPQGRGYEYIEKYPWMTEAQQASEEAVAKLKAKSVVPGKYDLVLHPSHLLSDHPRIGWPSRRSSIERFGGKRTMQAPAFSRQIRPESFSTDRRLSTSLPTEHNLQDLPP